MDLTLPHMLPPGATESQTEGIHDTRKGSLIRSTLRCLCSPKKAAAKEGTIAGHREWGLRFKVMGDTNDDDIIHS
ncbi:MAG: hypothetical protein FRX49_12400 [Trebouxia sp. A1-2]|nr:MAG: hypothetical protein FRX49_12400 [Trebouxia sp. A1-2]